MKYKFRKLKEKHTTSEFWDDLTNDYLKAEDFSKDPETIKAINEAIKLLSICEEMCEEF